MVCCSNSGCPTSPNWKYLSYRQGLVVRVLHKIRRTYRRPFVIWKNTRKRKKL